MMVKFSTGQVIMKDKPFVYVLNPLQIGKRCDYCFEESSTFVQCPGCRIKFYCNESCRSKDWLAFHEYGECDFYSGDIENFSHRLFDLDTSRLLLRLSLLLTKRPELAFEKCGINIENGSPRTYNALMDHRVNIEKDVERMTMFEEMYRIFTDSNLSFDREILLSAYGKILINGYSISDSLFQEMGYGVYIGASQFDHSCNPNCIPVFDGTMIILNALSDIDTDVEPVTVPYLGLTLTKAERQQEFITKFYFECKCTRCTQGCDIDPDYEDKMSLFFQLLIEKKWESADELGRRLITIYENYFQSYNPELTVHLVQILQIRRNMGGEFFKLKDTITREVKEKLDKAILVTHGTDHSLYRNEYLDLLKDLHQTE